MIHLYAITDPGAPLPAVAGVADSVVEVVPCGTVAAVCSANATPPRRDRATVLGHARVIAAVADVTRVLPVRFGAVFADRAVMREAITRKDRDLADQLATVGEAVEIVVRRRPAEVAAPGPPTATSGRAYLSARADELDAVARSEAADRRVVAELAAPVAATALDVRERSTARGHERSFLVPRDRAEHFLDVVRDGAAGDDRVVVGGPWPPYSFVDVEVSA